MFLLAATSAVHADERSLSASDITAQLRPISPEIERCYLERTAEVRGAGHLAIVLTIDKHGILDQLSVKTPGIAARVSKQIESCIRETVAPMSFPKKRVTTTATVPYFFQRTVAPNAGPQLSCFDPAGCHAKK